MSSLAALMRAFGAARAWIACVYTARSIFAVVETVAVDVVVADGLIARMRAGAALVAAVVGAIVAVVALEVRRAGSLRVGHDGVRLAIADGRVW
jgi:hypothetical protein